MRVPVLKQQSVAARNPFGDTSPNLQQANLGSAQALGALAQDVGQLGQSVGNVMEQQAREERQASAKALHEAEVAKRRAEELQVADGLVDLQRRVGDDESKFLGRKGLDAVRASGSTLDAFDKYVEEGAKRYTDPTQKLEFQVRAKQALLAARRSVESHTTREYAAGTATTFANLRDAAVRNAGSVDLSPAEMASALAPVDQAADEFFPAELAKTAKTELRADMAEAVIQRHLEAGNIEKAKAQLEADRSLFAPKRATQLGAAIDRANAGAEKDRVAGEVAKLVDTSAEAVRTPDGYVTEEELRKAVPVEGYEGQQRDQVEAEIRQRLQLERAKLKADIEKNRDNVNRADLQGRKAGAAELFLEKYDPYFLLARQARRRADARAARAARGSTSDRRAQQEDDEAYRAFLRRRIIEDPSITAEQAEVEFGPYMKEKYGRDVAVSVAERELGVAKVVEERKKAGTKEAAQARANASRIEKVITAASRSKLEKGKKLDPAVVNDEVGRALVLFDQRVEANGGKPFTEADWADFEEFLATEQIVERPGRFWGHNEVNLGRPGQQKPEASTTPPSAKPAGPVKMKFPDGKTYEVSPEKLDAAKKKGGVIVNG